ncbi:MAG TPA: signal peptidase II [Chlamydiales bacterium]|jgi:signal peptidase II|nr:signal peptidase II [Chlamydiales bacterium]
MKKWILLFASLLGLDAASKALANAFVPAMLPKIFGYPYGGIPVFEISGVSFSLNMVVNSGAAWGIFQGYSGFLFLLRSLIIGGLIAYLLFFNKGKTPSLPLWLIVTGAIGNGIDYLVYGHVIDFFHFCFWGYSFAIFNLADCFITFGVFGLLLFSRSAKFRTI